MTYREAYEKGMRLLAEQGIEEAKPMRVCFWNMSVIRIIRRCIHRADGYWMRFRNKLMLTI